MCRNTIGNLRFKSKMKTVTISTILAIGMSAAADATVVTVTGVTGHNGGNWSGTLGHLTDMVNGNGSNDFGSADHFPGMDTSADINDPSQWVHSSSNWQSEWLGSTILDSTNSLNNKIGWAVFDFGSLVAGLENIYIWSNRSIGGAGERTNAYNIYYSSGTGIDALPSMANAGQVSDTQTANPGYAVQGDYDFSSGDWTQLGSYNLQQPSSPWGPDATESLGGVSAQYIGIEIISGHGTDDRIGLGQVEFTAIPEPSTALLGAFGFLPLLRRRR
jgi:hypothetical protein